MSFSSMSPQTQRDSHNHGDSVKKRMQIQQTKMQNIDSTSRFENVKRTSVDNRGQSFQSSLLQKTAKNLSVFKRKPTEDESFSSQKVSKRSCGNVRSKSVSLLDSSAPTKENHAANGSNFSQKNKISSNIELSL